MSTIIVKRTGGYSPDSGAGTVAVVSAEAAMMRRLLPYASAKTAIWIDAASSRLYSGLGASDPPGLARLVDRVGGRVFTREPFWKRHPIVMNVLGKPAFLLGAGGSSPNALTQPANGVLLCSSEFDSSGAEANNPPLIQPGTGWSVAFKVIVPAASATVGGIVFPSATGGSLIGNRSLDATKSWRVTIDFSSGHFQVRNQENGGTNGLFVDAIDHRDSAADHTYIATYNATTDEIKFWKDAGAVVTQAGKTVDIDNTSPGSNKVMLFGVSDDAGGPGNRFVGFARCVFYVPDPMFEDSTARAEVLALMATR